jgi:hypothetical protein
MAGAKLGSVRSPDGGSGLRDWIARTRWRRRGAWLWPAFIALTIVDAVIGHSLPPQGETQSLAGAALLAGVLNLVAVVLLTRPLGGVLRRLRPDLPKVVARDYAGRALILAVAVALTIAGLVHHPTIVAHQQAMRDAIVRAQAWIGDRAPAEFRRNVQFVSTFTIEPGSMYRMCVPSQNGRRSYCVIVKTRLPFQRSVSFAGYEPNSVFAEGTG